MLRRARNAHAVDYFDLWRPNAESAIPSLWTSLQSGPSCDSLWTSLHRWIEGRGTGAHPITGTCASGELIRRSASMKGPRTLVAVGTLVVRLQPRKLVLWSNTVDAPVSPVLDRDHLIEFLLEREEVTYDKAAAIVDAAEQHGTSDPSLTAEEVLANNRAGKSEETLDVPSMIALYS